jgi:hypothetical protein
MYGDSGRQWGNVPGRWLRALVSGAVAVTVLLGAVRPVLAEGLDSDELQSGLAGDAFVAPAPDGLSTSDSPLPAYAQTSEYMIGHVAVGVVLPESSGNIEASSEDWTQAERDLVKGKVEAAFNWWAARSPQARLSFTYDDGTQSPIPTNYEPIAHPQSDEGLWIRETMEAKGFDYQGSYFDQVRRYNNWLREEHEADWAVTVFVVDSSNDADGKFAANPYAYFAYAYINGPFTVITYDNGGYGPDNMDAVLAHEIGHLFGALDQYAAAQVPCTLAAGYLSVPTGNSQTGGCPSNVASIMRGGVAPYRSGSIDAYAAGQIGWNDTDGDGILDPLDTPIDLQASGQALSGGDGVSFSYAGHVNQTAFPSDSRPEVLINPLAEVQYRVNNGAWQMAAASDGAYDSLEEAFSFVTVPLDDSESSVDIRVVDGWGNSLYQVRVLGEADTYRVSLPMVVR